MDHRYRLDVTWQGNRGTGTSGYRDYGRDVLLSAEGKPDLAASADPTFRGDRTRWNPEELLVAALSQCHLLSYLHSAVRHGIVVTAYDDAPVGTMSQSGDGGRFTDVLLRPRVAIADPGLVGLAREIHAEASRNCFIAASVNFPVRHDPEIVVAAAG
ncbi:OsmC family peroxiredoxin [Nocardioides sp. GY 10113]|uniref:OsmC family protein n=1 Tax=Nocardioides sp. GY 10113 TaxID=2569761 RepID=UPI0010A8E527|nr:OsmC family protein [Nocardioides sp. GY 10113]TIC85863.1 OsmC family peroxiredoxin [Nocardioides sp. GY 10113]